MAVQSTLLSVIINRMKRRQALSRVEDGDLIRDLDESIRTIRRTTQLPWSLKKGSLKVFHDVLEYPVPSDYDELAYLDSNKNANFYPARARFKFTSLPEFYENPDYRNDIAEIFDQGSRYLGVRYHPESSSSRLLNPAEDASYYSDDGDASLVGVDNVVFKEGNNSMRFDIVSSSGVANLKANFVSAFTDSNYKRKYHFAWIYLDAAPTSITMRFKVDASNYLETTGITTQFSGQPFQADAWNLIAHDLNTATATGTVSTSSLWAAEEIILNGAATGTYYLDATYQRSWELLDLWYYSKYTVKTVSASVADQEYFYLNEVYSTDSSLVCDSEWTDFFQYDAEVMALSDLKEWELVKEAKERRGIAWNNLIMKYPNLSPVIITTGYRHTTDFNEFDSYDIN